MTQELERKYALTHIVGDTEQIIKVFDTKDDAIAYGDAVAHDYKDGTVACIQALFDFSTNKMSASRRVFHVWA